MASRSSSSSSAPASPPSPPRRLPLEELPSGTPPAIRSRRRRQQRRQASTQSTSPPTTPEALSINKLHSFPPFRENDGVFKRKARRFFSHVAWLVSGGTALLYQPVESSVHLPTASYPFPFFSNSRGSFFSSTRRSSPKPSATTISEPQLVFPRISCGQSCCGGLSRPPPSPPSEPELIFPRIGCGQPCCGELSPSSPSSPSSTSSSVPDLIFPRIGCGQPCCGELSPDFSPEPSSPEPSSQGDASPPISDGGSEPTSLTHGDFVMSQSWMSACDYGFDNSAAL